MASSTREERNSGSGEQKKHPDSSDSKVGIFKKSASIIFATKTIKANLAAGKERLSFPLLRRVISQKLEQEKFRPFKDIDTGDLQRSAKNHLLMIFLMFPILFWAAIIFARGLGALVKFSEFTTWLLYGALLIIISATHILKSSTSRRNALAELARRDLK